MTSKAHKIFRRTGIVLGSITLLNFIPIWNIFFFISEPLGKSIAQFLIYSVLLVPVAMIMGLIDLAITVSRRRDAKKFEPSSNQSKA